MAKAVLSRGVSHFAGSGAVHVVLSCDTVLLVSAIARAQIEEEAGPILEAIREAARTDAEGWEEDEAIHDVALLARLGVLARLAGAKGIES
jgi:hypothetical protein